MHTTDMNPDTASIGVSDPKRILQSVLTALNEGRIAEAVAQFDDHFTFTDHALDLEFTDKGRLIEFFQKSKKLFPDTVVEVDSSFQCGDHVVAEWKLKGTIQTALNGVTRFRFPISLRGISIVHIDNGRITHWSATTTKIDLGGSVWLHFSESGSSTSEVLANSVLR